MIYKYKGLIFRPTILNNNYIRLTTSMKPIKAGLFSNRKFLEWRSLPKGQREKYAIRGKG